jgi:phenylalanyl-tRNA synthetase beta chain
VSRPAVAFRISVSSRRPCAISRWSSTTGGAFAVEAVEVFDVYRGTGLPDGKKSVAYALSFRSAERTLTDDEVNVVFTKIQQGMVADGSVSVRA